MPSSQMPASAIEYDVIVRRIRLDVSSSNFPRFDVNPNTGGPLGRERRFELAENAVYHDPQHPSHVVLPVIPASS